MDKTKISPPLSRSEKDKAKGQRAAAIGKAKAWARYLKKEIAIVDYGLIVRPDGSRRGMAPTERDRAKTVLHGEPFNKTGEVLAISSHASMKMPNFDLRPDDPKAIKWPGTPPEGPGEVRTAEFGNALDYDEDVAPMIEDDKNWMDKPEYQEERPVAKPRLPEDAVVGSDDMAGPNPLIVQLTNAGYSEEEARAIAKGKKIEQPKPGVDVTVGEAEGEGEVVEDHDPAKRPDIVLVDNVGFKLKHYLWLENRAKQSNLPFQRLIDQIIANAFAADPLRHSVGTRSGGFSGRREDFKDFQGKL